jgi:hypothetical protein
LVAIAEGLAIAASRSFAACPRQQLAQEPRYKPSAIEDFIETIWLQVYTENAAGVESFLKHAPLRIKCDFTPIRFK